MDIGASPGHSGHAVDTRSGKHPRLEMDEHLYTRHVPAFEGMKHVFTYDRSSVHKPPQAPSATSRSSPTPAAARGSRTGSPPSNARQRLRAQKRSDALYADLPPLQQIEEDDEDYEDNKTFMQYSAETNRWLLFSGVFALIITLFIVNFSMLPHQAHRRRQTQELVVQLAQISERLEAAPNLDPAASSFSSVLSSLNLTQYVNPPPPTLAMEIRDEWAPAFWYTSLMVTLMGTILILMIKHWLMACSFAMWVLDDDDFQPVEKPRTFQEELRELQRDHARMRKRKEEVRKTRKEALRKTERVKHAVPFMMYSALGIFVVGVAAKLGSMVWIGY